MPSFHNQRITGFLHQRRVAAAVPAAPAPASVTKPPKPKDKDPAKTRHAIRDEVFRSFKRS